MSRTHVVSVHPFRRVARKRERAIQAWLDEGRPLRAGVIPDEHQRIPEWANGARVERAGLLQHAVIATEQKGH